MSELIKLAVIRPSQALTADQISRAAYHTHPESRWSRRYRAWLERCRAQSAEAHALMLAEMAEFLQSESALLKLNAMPSAARQLVELVHAQGLEFSQKAFVRLVGKAFSGEKERAQIASAISTLEDVVLARTQVDDAPQPDFDPQQALLVLDLAARMAERKEDSKRPWPIGQLLRRPILLPPCFLPFDPCWRQKHEPRNPFAQENEKNDQATTDPDKPCRCKTDAEADPCHCECDDECIIQDKCCARLVPYVGELLVVRDEVSCYEPGELSYIENVIQGETRERTHRHLQRQEIYTEQEETTTTIEERNQQVEERYALHKEVENIVHAELAVEAGVSYTMGVEKGPYYFTSHLDVSSEVARTDAQKIASDESRKVIEKAISRVEKKVRSLRTHRLIDEIEETNVHTFNGVTDLSRQFYYVNQVRKGQLYSYGYRMMLDFYLPEPAALYKRLLEKEFDLERPEKPCINIEDIDPADYLEYVQCHGFTDLEPPKETLPGKWMVVEVKQEKPRKSGNPWAVTAAVNIPPGYRATQMKLVHPVINRSSPFKPNTVTFNLGSTNLIDTWNSNDGSPPDEHGPKPLPNLTGNHTATITAYRLKRYTLRIHIWLEGIPADNSEWQREVHSRLCAKYEAELEAWEAARAEFERTKMDKFNRHPFSLSQTIKDQLKHMAISYITCQFFDGNNALVNRVQPCGFPQMDLRETEKEGRIIRFFEHALEWNFMSYMLYPYFWGRKCTWEEKLGHELPHVLFSKFMQAGAARVTLSVRPGFEAYMAYYLATGKIWGNTGIPPLFGNGFLPIHQEIKESKDNFNTDREGQVICDTSLGLPPNMIALQNNTDYYDSTPAFDPLLTEPDLNREIVIDCVVYKIVNIHEDSGSGEIIITLDRDFEGDKDRVYPWSTGALYVGAPWAFRLPTSLVWLRENKRCLPCYPIACTE